MLAEYVKAFISGLWAVISYVIGISEGPPGRARELIANAPAVDVVPVRHGEWFISINAKDGKVTGTICPICGFAWSEAIDAVKLEPCLSLIKTPYCPNCGAKMDGEA